MALAVAVGHAHTDVRLRSSLLTRGSALPAARLDRGDRVVLRDGVVLDTSAAAEAAIQRGEQQVRVVDGVTLRYPSQNLSAIESSHPAEPGQTHDLARHIGTSLASNIARLQREPLIRAAGGYYDLAHAQRATDRTIANPANQARIGAFLATGACEKIALERIDVREVAGASTLRSDLDAGHPALVPGRTATVILIRDPSFPEGYRVLTTFPDTRPPQVDAAGHELR